MPARQQPDDYDYDIIFAGGGLSSALTAYRIKLAHPHLRILIIEAGERLGGNHTWSFHDGDLTEQQRIWIAPLVAHRWHSQAVRFPRFSRTLASGYNSITSPSLHRAVLARLGAGAALRETVLALDENTAQVASSRLSARCIIDGRGYAPSPALVLGFQKFLGQEVRCAVPHGQSTPVIMDATVSQADGYRFVYTLPLSADRLLIEDTYYADGPDLDAGLLRERIAAYAAERGWRIAAVARAEHGILPIVLAGDIDAFWAERRMAGPAAPIGLRAALFHPTTGYSLADAVRLADALVELPTLTTSQVRHFVEQWSRRLWRERGFYRMLNRMLFRAAEPGQRYEVLQRFYTLPEGVVARFYAAASTNADKARILIGRPPVSLRKALASMPEASAWQA